MGNRKQKIFDLWQILFDLEQLQMTRHMKMSANLFCDVLFM